jgi:hypothetical protein
VDLHVEQILTELSGFSQEKCDEGTKERDQALGREGISMRGLT